MRKKLLLLLLPIIIGFFSCTKSIEDRIVGSWKLDQAYRQNLFSRDHFQTGFENGTFTFFENGDAKYVSSTDTLNGNWRADRYSNSYYNNSSNDWENRSMKYLRLHLVDFSQNKFIEWEFDDFTFKNGHQTIKAEQYSFSNDRVYEFVRQ